jgi:hypothetical protein
VDKWEYKSIIVGGPSLESELAPLGDQGWEAVGFVPVVHDPTNNTGHHNQMDGGWVITTVTQWSAWSYRVLLKHRKP